MHPSFTSCNGFLFHFIFRSAYNGAACHFYFPTKHGARLQRDVVYM